MRSLSILILISLLAGAMPVDATDYYELPNIKRLDRDLYLSGQVVIETRFCLHLPAGEEALLKYEGPGEYEVVWEDHSTCDVQKVALEGSDSGAAKL